MIGRVVCAALFVASVAVDSAWAATAGPQAAVTGVTYRNGVVGWERIERRAVHPPTITKLTTALAPGRERLLSRGRAGMVEIRVYCTQRDGGPVHRHVVAKILLRKPRARIVAEGVGSSALTDFEARGLLHMALVARSAIVMLATAYTGASAGGNGFTASGRPAGYGIVAVDPRVIPLGTRLYISGYGFAVAGDTGGDIVGRRIDLGFNSTDSAMAFGRRTVIVYRLK